MKPEGHFGFTAVTFLVVFPFIQVIVIFFWMGTCDGVAVTTGAGVGVVAGVAVVSGNFASKNFRASLSKVVL